MTRHIAPLDGLRAVSIAFVIYAHLSMANAIPKAIHFTSLGLDGVLIFFAISGYLITSQLLHEKRATGTIHIGYFWLRRAFRLLPASFVLIFVTWLISRLGYFHMERAALMHALTYTMDYYHPLSNTLGHLWSLSVEEQFYLAWPFVALLAGCRGSKAACLAVLVVCPCLRVWAWYFGPIDHDLVFRRFDMVADSLAAGCLLSLIEDKLPKWTRSNTAVVVSFAVILAVGIVASRASAFVIAQITLDGFCAAVIIHSLNDGSLLTSRWLSWAPLVWLGAISYSLYLWQTLFTLSRPALPFKIFLFPYSLAGMLACAMASYYLLERPIRVWGKRFRPPVRKAEAHFKVAA